MTDFSYPLDKSFKTLTCDQWEEPEVNHWVTGKFVMAVKEDADKNSFLSIVVELAEGVEMNDQKHQLITSSITSQLLRLNSEFANYVPAAFQEPKVVLLPLGEPRYFPPGIKHRYTEQGNR